MAYSFNGTDQSLSTASTPVTGTPLTMFVHLNSATASGLGRSLVITRATTNDRFNLQYNSTSAGFEANQPPVGNGTAILLSAISANTWLTLTGVSENNTSRFVFANATKSGINTTDRTPTTGGMIIRIGAQATSFVNGLLAEAAIWDVVLTDDEVRSLARGFKPPRVRPQNLQFYAPIVRNLQDLRGGLTITNNNSAPVANHPRVY
jgi:hypothetical protein